MTVQSLAEMEAWVDMLHFLAQPKRRMATNL